MRNLFSSVIAATALLIISAPLAAQAPTKIGYIDTRRVISEAPGATEVQTTLQKEVEGWQAELKLLDDSLRAMMTDYQQKSVVMSAESKQKREGEIRQKQQAAQQRAQQLEQTAARRQQELMEPIMQRVEAVISDVRKAEGFAIVFDAASDAIVSADPTLDITLKVIERLRAAAPASAARTP